MNKWFRNSLNSTRFRLLMLVIGIVVLIPVGVVVANSVKNAKSSGSLSVNQDITKAELVSQEDFSLGIEQDEDAPLKILDARVKTISGDQYQTLTSEATLLQEVVSVPEVAFQNVSDKVIVGVTLIINDKEAKTNRGLYIREQSIAPGDKFTIYPENFVRVEDNPAKNPKFWLSVKDKSQVVVRVVVNFKDGSLWANKNYGVQ